MASKYAASGIFDSSAGGGHNYKNRRKESLNGLAKSRGGLMANQKSSAKSDQMAGRHLARDNQAVAAPREIPARGGCAPVASDRQSSAKNSASKAGAIFWRKPSSGGDKEKLLHYSL